MRTRRLALTTVLALFLGTLQLPGGGPQPAGSGLWDRLLGSWKGEGTFSAAPARSVVTWERVLDGRFYRLTVRVDFTPANGPERSFSGHGYYATGAEGRVTGRWFDSQGNSYDLTGEWDEGALMILWGDAVAPRGRSVYRVSEAGELRVTDSVRAADGTFKEFSRLTLTRDNSKSPPIEPAPK